MPCGKTLPNYNLKRISIHLKRPDDHSKNFHIVYSEIDYLFEEGAGLQSASRWQNNGREGGGIPPPPGQLVSVSSRFSSISTDPGNTRYRYHSRSGPRTQTSRKISRVTGSARSSSISFLHDCPIAATS